MKRRSFVGALVALFSFGFGLSKKSNLPRVLILGDSIAKGYYPSAKKQLENVCELHRPVDDKGRPINCMDTQKGLLNMKEWLTKQPWDIIHFNFGLHDLKHVDPVTGKGSADPSHPVKTTLITYQANLEKLIVCLQKTTSKLIFATTTPVPQEVKGRPYREEGIELDYNRCALEVMRKHNVIINDLHDLVLTKRNLQKPNNVHFTKKGYQTLANAVARKIRTSLN